MRAAVRAGTAGRFGRALISPGTIAGFALVARGTAQAIPPGCTQTGNNFVCTAGIPAGDVTTITGGPIDGTVDAFGGNDTVAVTGGAGGAGGAGGNGGTGCSGPGGAGGLGNAGTVEAGAGVFTGSSGSTGANGVNGVDNGGVCSC